MKIAMIGLGKMGANMTKRLLLGGHQVVVYDLNQESVDRTRAEGAEAAASMEDVVARLQQPRVIWVMVPAGGATESTVNALAGLLAPGDIVIDGGNSNYKDSVRRARVLAERGLHFVDVGTSGGVWGLEEGYSMMIGGEAEVVERLRPIIETLAPAAEKGWGHVGPSGSGHYVKMIHNGIEYGLMEAYAEGFELLRAKKEFGLDLHQVAELWRHGSVVRSWLLDLLAAALLEDVELSTIQGWVPDSGEGRWTVVEAIDLDVPAPVITLALQARFISRERDRFRYKLLAALRHQFGGHAVKEITE